MKPIERKRTSVVTVHGEKLLTFRAVDPHSGDEYLFLPGGKIEEGEEAWQAAERETLEETGYHVRVLKETQIEKRHPFRWNGNDYFSITTFYAAPLAEPYFDPKPVDDEPYNKGVVWLHKEEIEMAFAYCEPITDAILQLLPVAERR